MKSYENSKKIKLDIQKQAIVLAINSLVNNTEETSLKRVDYRIL